MFKNIKVIVFDLDNCIILDESTGEGSEDLKQEVWYKVFPAPDFPARTKLATILAAAHKLVVGGRGDRKDIARHVLTTTNFKTDDIEVEVVRRCESFDHMLQRDIVSIAISREKRQVLAAMRELMPLYINTATPIATVHQSLEGLDLTRYFSGVLGRPGTKVSNLRDIIATEGVDPSTVLYVDDHPAGWQVAQEVGCQFVGIRTKRVREWHARPQPFPLVSSLSELLEMV